jgi:hypothetical protein
MRDRPTILAIVLIAALATTGCGPGDPAESGPIDWPRVAARDLNCANDTVKLIGSPDTGDIDGDGTADFFVTMRCTSPEHPDDAPGQLEVFKGGTPRDNPTRLAVIVRNWENYQLTGCVSLTEGKAYTRATKDGTAIVRGAQLVPHGKQKRVEAFDSGNRDQIAGCS